MENTNKTKYKLEDNPLSTSASEDKSWSLLQQNDNIYIDAEKQQKFDKKPEYITSFSALRANHDGPKLKR